MKLHMQTPHESRMCPIDFEVQRSRSQCINYWKWFPAHNCFPFTPIIMKLHMQTLHEARMCPIDFQVKRSKVKVKMHKLLKMVSSTLLLSLYTYHHETVHADSPWVKDVPYRFSGQNVKGQGHNGDFDILKNCPRGGYLSRQDSPDLVLCVSHFNLVNIQNKPSYTASSNFAHKRVWEYELF